MAQLAPPRAGLGPSKALAELSQAAKGGVPSSAHPGRKKQNIKVNAGPGKHRSDLNCSQVFCPSFGIEEKRRADAQGLGRDHG
jgi:hypothetical protein